MTPQQACVMIKSQGERIQVERLSAGWQFRDSCNSQVHSNLRTEQVMATGRGGSASETSSAWGWLHRNWYRFPDLATSLSPFSFIPQSNQHENSQICRQGTRGRLPISHFGSEPQREEDQESEKVMILRRRENRTWGKKELKAPEWPWMTCVLTYQNQNESAWLLHHLISNPTQWNQNS